MTKQTPLRGTVRVDAQGFWIEYVHEGKPVQVGPLSSLDEARQVVQKVLDTAQADYECRGYKARPWYRDRGGSA